MSKAFEMISESLNEIIEDLEKNDGKNLNREIVTLKERKISTENRRAEHWDFCTKELTAGAMS